MSTTSLSDDDTGLGDIGLVPAAFFWNAGNFHYNLYELIIAPTGEYDVGNSVIIGRNYWSFDTVAAVTWFNKKTGTDVTFVQA